MSQEIEKYEFVRIRDKRNGEVMKSWYFRARSYHDIRVHTEKVFAPLMQVGYNDVAGKAVEAIFGKGKLCCVEHPDTDAGNAIRTFTEIEYGSAHPMPMFEVANKLLAEAVQSRLDEVYRNGECYLADGVQCFGFSKSCHEICESVLSDEFKYPTTKRATLKDVRFILWDGGRHIYAKVGNFDVVDEHGNQKWNTKEDAVMAAENFLKREKIYV